MTATDIGRAVSKLREALVPAERCQKLVGLFYADDGPFAGKSFLEIEPSDPNRITASDLLAVTFMGEIYPPLAVRQLLHGAVGREAESFLAEIPADENLANVKDEVLHEEAGPYVGFWQALMPLHGVAETKVSKLMARKRPGLFPIYDSVIGERVAHVSEYWHVFRAFFEEPDAMSLVNELRSDTLPPDLPALRILDTAVWMRYSRGRSAISARAEAGL